MRKLSILLLLIGIPFMIIEANSLSTQRTKIIRWLTSPVLAWGLNDIWVGLLNLVPGKTTIKGLVEINPGISLGGKVTDIHLRYIKKCLWLVDVRHTIFSYAAHMNSNLLYDTYPSSYYDLAKAQQKIEGNQEDGIPIVGKYDYNVSMWNSNSVYTNIQCFMRWTWTAESDSQYVPPKS